VRIAAQRSLMAELAQEVTQSRMILQIPGRQVRWLRIPMKSSSDSGVIRPPFPI